MKNTIKKMIKTAYQNIVGDERASLLTDQTSLMPSSETLDSRDFVMLVVTVEREISEHFDCQISLISDKAFSEKHSPFQSVDAFANFIEQLIIERLEPANASSH